MRKFAAVFIFSLALLGSCSNDDRVNLPAPNPEDFLGEIDFITTFGGSQNEAIVSVVQASDGGYVLMGTTDSTDGDITGKNGD